MKNSNKKTYVHIDPVQGQKDLQRRMLIFAVCVVLLSAVVGLLYWETTTTGTPTAEEVETESILEENSAE